MARAIVAPRCARVFGSLIVVLALALTATSSWARVESTDPSVSYSAGWTVDTSRAWSGGSAMVTKATGNQATLTFNGTSVNWIGARGTATGIARVFVDGVMRADVDTYQPSEEIRVSMFTVNDLANTTHTLTIQALGTKNALSSDTIIVVDAFEAPAISVSRLQETDGAVAYTGTWAFGDATHSWSEGTAATSNTTNSQATFTFVGTKVSWISSRMTSTGIAGIFLDGAHVTDVDTYAASDQTQAELYTSPTLANGTHTLAIRVTGTKNAASSGTTIVADAFEVTVPGRRYQDYDPSINYSPPNTWMPGTRDHAYNEGTVVEAFSAATATFPFNGTGISFVSGMCSRCGIVNVAIDGGAPTVVDLYEVGDAPQKTVFSTSGLAAGPHTITLTVTGQKNPLSTFSWVVVDAFDVIGGGGPPPSCTYAMSPTDLSNRPAAGGVVNVTVTTASGCAVAATSFQPWVQVNSVTPNGGTTTVQLQLSANGGGPRATSIRLGDRLFLVTQLGS